MSENVPITLVSKILGHANPAITMSIYAHELKEDFEQVRVDWTVTQSILPSAIVRLRSGDEAEISEALREQLILTTGSPMTVDKLAQLYL